MAVHVTGTSPDRCEGATARPGLLVRHGQVAAIAVIVVFGILATALIVRTWRSTPSFDFRMMYTRALGVRSGENLYGCSRQWQAERYTFWLPGRIDPCGAYMYAPVFALAITPLTEASFETAQAVWFVASVGAVAMSAFLLARLAYRRGLLMQVALATAMFTGIVILRPVTATLKLGQTDAFVLLALTASLYFYTSGKVQLAALCLAGALLIKPLFWPVILLFLLRRHYRAVALVTAIGLGGALISVWAVGIDSIRDFVETTRYFTSAWAAVSPQNESAYSLALRLFAPNPFTQPVIEVSGIALAVKALAPILAAGAMLLVVRRASDDRRSTRQLEFSVALCLSLLATPFYEHTHASYLIIPLVTVAALAWSRPRTRTHWLILGGTAGTLALLAMPRLEGVSLAFYRFRDAPLTLPYTLLTGIYLYAAIATTVVVVAAIRFRLRADEPGTAAIPGTSATP